MLLLVLFKPLIIAAAVQGQPHCFCTDYDVKLLASPAIVHCQHVRLCIASQGEAIQGFISQHQGL